MTFRQMGLGIVAVTALGFGFSTGALAATCSTNDFTTSTACETGTGKINVDTMNNGNVFGISGWSFAGGSEANAKIDIKDDNDSPFTSIFSLTIDRDDEGEATSGGWSLTSGFSFDATKTYAFALKGSTDNAFYLLDTAFTSGNWNTLGLGGSGLSNITLFEAAAPAAVPLPAAAWLFGSALLGLAGAGYRRKLAKSA